MHAPLHAIIPAEQQTPFAQTCDVPHVFEQLPQCALLLESETHVFPHFVCPDPHDPPHVPLKHALSLGHDVPHSPQFSLSLDRSAHVPLQFSRPG